MLEMKSKIDWQLWLGISIAFVLVVNVGLLFMIRGGAFAAGNPFSTLRITLLDTTNCEECFDLGPLRDYLTQNGVEDGQIESVDADSREGKRLVKKFNITKVPTAIIPESVAGLEFMQGVVENLGVIKDGAFVMTELQPPYLDLESNEVIGRFELTVLTDSSCETCYDPALHDDVLGRLAMTPSKRTEIDVNSEEGQALVESYVITTVPTVLLRGDLDPYTTLQDIWTSVGTKEDDGTYVLRQGVANMGTYKRLSDGAIIEPEPAETAPTS